MESITLEKVDMVRQRTGLSYAKAKEVLEKCDGDVLEALIYIEENEEFKENIEADECEATQTSISVEELKAWIKELIEKGNVTRIKIKKDEKELIDVPVNAGIAAGVVGIIIPPILAAAFIAAIATQITIEITREDGSVEVVNKYVSKVANEVKNKANNLVDKVKYKVDEVKNENKTSKDDEDHKVYTGGDSIFSYTVNFDDDKDK